jgi:opacity protein-like surface antigen
VKQSTIAVGVLLLAFSPAARAEPKLERGTHELSVHVSPDFEGAIGDMLLAQAGYAIFLRDRLAARGTLGYAVLEDVAGEDSDYRMQELGVAVEYHLAFWGKAVPYLGAGVGWRRSHFGDLDASGLVYGPRAGLKVFLADNVALDFEVTYKASSEAVFVNDFVAEDTDLTSVIGLRVSF